MSKLMTYGKGFTFGPVVTGRQKIDALQAEVAKLPPYQPETKHYFHAGMYCREVFRPAGVLIVGKVHKREHFYLVASGTVLITDGNGVAEEITGPRLFLSKPGVKRAVMSMTDTLTMTFHVTDAATVDEAEEQLVEEDPTSAFTVGNMIKAERIEVMS